MAAALGLSLPAGASAFDWIKADCSEPGQTMCIDSLEVKGNGDPDSSYVPNTDLKAVGKPYPNDYGEGLVLSLVRPVNPYTNRLYVGPSQCQSPPASLMFIAVEPGREAYCRDLVAATLAPAPGAPSGPPRAIESLEGKTVRVKVRLGTFVPRYSVVVGSGRGDLPEASVANRTWSVDSSSGQNVLTVVLKPEFTDGLMVGQDWCSFAAGCGPGPANWRGIMVSAYFGEFAKFPRPDLIPGTTVFTNAFRYDSLKVDLVNRSMSVQIAGPHLRMDGSLNSAFAGVFIPASLANSTIGFGIPASDAQLATSLRAFRDNGQAVMSASITRDSGGVATGIYGEVSGITFSAPTYAFRGPARQAPPRKPSAKTALNRKKRTFTAAISPEAGVSYSVSASLAGGKKAKTRAGKCAPVKKTGKVACTIKLSKGKWRVSILGSREGVSGAALTKNISIR